jgi:hypothetical protein
MTLHRDRVRCDGIVPWCAAMVLASSVASCRPAPVTRDTAPAATPGDDTRERATACTLANPRPAVPATHRRRESSTTPKSTPSVRMMVAPLATLR